MRAITVLLLHLLYMVNCINRLVWFVLISLFYKFLRIVTDSWFREVRLLTLRLLLANIVRRDGNLNVIII